MNHLNKAIFAIATLTLAGQAHAATITFEEAGLVAMNNSPGSAVPIGAQLSNQFLATDGVLFTSGAGYAAVVDHGFPALTEPHWRNYSWRNSRLLRCNWRFILHDS